MADESEEETCDQIGQNSGQVSDSINKKQAFCCNFKIRNVLRIENLLPADNFSTYSRSRLIQIVPIILILYRRQDTINSRLLYFGIIPYHLQTKVTYTER